MALAETICGKRTKYDRGIWYNSAKFMDIEYQTYGFVSNHMRDGESSFYWEHDDHRHCARIVYNTDDEFVTGCNFFGIRQRQDVWQRWIKDCKTIDYVIANLREANFDPEFFMQYEDNITAEYNRQRGRDITIKGKRSIWSRILT
jgi:hypothetical protein